MQLDNSFISTTMCDDLARATEAQDGKKMIARNAVKKKAHRLCEKAPCTDLSPDPTLHQFSTELRRRTRTSTTHTKHKRSACSHKT